MKNGEMTVKLISAMELLPELLRKKNIWKSVYIDYNTPIVERMYTDIEDPDVRISLHKIHKCEDGEAFFHPHPWPSAMFLLSGLYKMDVGYGKGIEEPEVSHTIYLNADSFYEMINPDAWHSVRPIRNSFTIMVSGKPWNRDMPKTPERRLPELTPERMEQMLVSFRTLLERVTIPSSL